MSDPTKRALALLTLLQTHRHWKGPDLAQRLGVSERTVRRDIDRLRGLGYPVDSGPGLDGGYTLAVGAHVPPLLLDDNEAVALAIGLRTAAVASLDGIEDTTIALMAKLDQILPDHLRRRVDALQHSVEVMSWSPTIETVPAASLIVLSQGCRDREEIRFDYQRRDGETSHRLVQPSQLVSAGRRWYLVAWDMRRNDWRTFRIDRMANPALAGARFEARPLPTETAAAFVAEGMREVAAVHRATVEVEASLEQVATIARRFDATPQTIDARRTRMDVQAVSLEWLASMIVILATSFDITITNAPDEVHEILGTAAHRISAAMRPTFVRTQEGGSLSDQLAAGVPAADSRR